MKMNGQSRSFVKQVQVDLLALSDAELYDIVQRWIEESDSSEVAHGIPEDTRLALGYTQVLPDVTLLDQFLTGVPGAERERPVEWHAPSPHELRRLISTMNVDVFAQHVITFAFKSLHPTHPEWYEGMTFNAHLANYLRQGGLKRQIITRRLG